MTIRHLALSLKGAGRANNEDCFSVCEESGLFVLSDGMGGHNAGEVASDIAVHGIIEYLRENMGNDEPDQLLEDSVAHANSEIFDAGREIAERRNMGATLAMVWQQEDRLYVVHVGDSRVYVFNPEHARSLTEDHSVVGELLREGAISREEALHHPKKNMLTRALGVEAYVQPDISVFQLPVPGYLLICSDGISAYLPLEQVLPQIAAKVKREQILPVLAELAKEAGSLDDITGILLWNEQEQEEASAND